MEISEDTIKKMHDELDKQIEVLKSRPLGGEFCIFDQAIITYEDDRSRTQDPNLVDNVVTRITGEFVLLNDGTFVLEDRSIRVGRVGDIEENDGDWEGLPI